MATHDASNRTRRAPVRDPRAAATTAAVPGRVRRAVGRRGGNVPHVGFRPAGGARAVAGQGPGSGGPRRPQPAVVYGGAGRGARRPRAHPARCCRFVRRSQAIDTRFDESAKILDQVQSRTSNVSEAELRETRAQLSRVLNAARASDPNLATSTEHGASTHGAPERLDGALWKQLREWMADEDYRAFQLRFRGDANEISRRMQAHVSRFENVPGPVADLGCGRGEFLELLRDANIEGIGVEINAADVASCVERGLQAECSDLFDWLEARRVETLGGIFIAQVIEHIPPPDWARLTDLAASRLTPGGRLVVETINPESLFALTRAYVLDPTHTRPVHPQLLAFLAQRSGLTDIDIAYQAEVPDACRVSPTNEEPFVGHPPSLAVVRELNLQMWQVNDLLAAPQEYTLSATRISSA